jgi:hypothetical protein
MPSLSFFSRAALGLLASAGCAFAAPAGGETRTAVIDNPGPGGNRIEVSGNTAGTVEVRCADGRAANSGPGVNVNSVDIDRRALQGRTVIVTGRNSRDVKTQVNCGDGAAAGATVNVNSVNIR